METIATFFTEAECYRFLDKPANARKNCIVERDIFSGQFHVIEVA